MFVSGMGFFTEFGPNTTTFIYPAEIFPTDVRTTGHGISAGAGKLGAFAGAFLFPDFLAVTLGLNRAMLIAGIVAAAGMLLTIATRTPTISSSAPVAGYRSWAACSARSACGARAPPGAR